MLENLEITWSTLLAFFGALAIMANGIGAIRNWLKPHNRNVARTAEVERTLEKLTKRQQEIDSALRVVYRCVSNLLDNEISPTGNEKLEEVREMLNQYLIDK